LVFILIGLELPVIMKGLDGYSLTEAWRYGLIISGVVIVIRLLWIYPGTYIPRWLFKSIRTTEPNPGWKNPFIVGWAGMRGVVSLAAALSLPLLTNAGKAFPHRNLIIFITFVVILVTLVFQGFTLPLLVKKMKIVDVDPAQPEDQQEMIVKLRLIEVALRRLNEHYFSEIENNYRLRVFKDELQNNVVHATARLDSLTHGDTHQAQIDIYRKAMKDIYQHQRKELYHIRKEKKFSEEVLRRQAMQIDLAEMKILNR
jgi:CPA1 family monovalent cation:H+ antiporter